MQIRKILLPQGSVIAEPARRPRRLWALNTFAI